MRRSYLKKVALNFVLYVLLEVIPHPSCYVTSTVDKTHHGPVVAPVSVQLLQLV